MFLPPGINFDFKEKCLVFLVPSELLKPRPAVIDYFLSMLLVHCIYCPFKAQNISLLKTNRCHLSEAMD